MQYIARSFIFNINPMRISRFYLIIASFLLFPLWASSQDNTDVQSISSYKILFKVTNSPNQTFKKLEKLGTISYEQSKVGNYLYYIGDFQNENDGKILLEKVHKEGFKVAEIVQVKNKTIPAKTSSVDNNSNSKEEKITQEPAVVSYKSNDSPELTKKEERELDKKEKERLKREKKAKEAEVKEAIEKERWHQKMLEKEAKEEMKDQKMADDTSSPNQIDSITNSLIGGNFKILFTVSTDPNLQFQNISKHGNITAEQSKSGHYKYYLGNFKSESEATKVLLDVKNEGYKVAEIIKIVPLNTSSQESTPIISKENASTDPSNSELERLNKENEMREKEMKEKEMREKEMKENEMREKEMKEKEMKEKEIREKEMEQREKKMKEQEIREREREMKEKAMKEQEKISESVSENMQASAYNSGEIYRILFTVSTDSNLTFNKLEGLGNIVKDQSKSGHYKYYLGDFNSLEEATMMLSKVKSEGFKVAEIIKSQSTMTSGNISSHDKEKPTMIEEEAPSEMTKREKRDLEKLQKEKEKEKEMEEKEKMEKEMKEIEMKEREVKKQEVKEKEMKEKEMKEMENSNSSISEPQVEPTVNNYRILFTVSSDPNLTFNKLERFGTILKQQSKSGHFKYYLGEFNSKQSADKVLNKVKNEGYKVAEVVKSKPGEVTGNVAPKEMEEVERPAESLVSESKEPELSKKEKRKLEKLEKERMKRERELKEMDMEAMEDKAKGKNLDNEKIIENGGMVKEDQEVMQASTDTKVNNNPSGSPHVATKTIDVFKILFTVSTGPDLAYDQLDNLGTVSIEQTKSGHFKYFLSPFNSEKEAVEALEKVKQSGFMAAEVVKFTETVVENSNVNKTPEKPMKPEAQAVTKSNPSGNIASKNDVKEQAIKDKEENDRMKKAAEEEKIKKEKEMEQMKKEKEMKEKEMKEKEMKEKQKTKKNKKSNSKTKVEKQSNTASNNKPSDGTIKNVEDRMDVSYHVLFRVLKDPNQTFPDLNSLGQIYKETFTWEGTTRYLLGDMDSVEEAKQLLDKVIAKGYKAAFVAKYSSGRFMREMK